MSQRTVGRSTPEFEGRPARAIVNRWLTTLDACPAHVGPGSLPITYPMLRACHRLRVRCRALATVAADIRPVMHGPMLLVLIIGLGAAGVVLTRLLLIPVAKALQ